ncbi:MAG: sporulation membrane protein YtaF [Oscillospiraceae bacterium]|nr:sporulation membrane protein YtaF [Oscillospiraceae bacterium]
MYFALIVLQAAVVASSVSIDSFAAGFAYSSNKIKIPFSSILIINIIGSAFMGVGLLVGNTLQNFIPIWVTAWLAFGILFILGLVKLLDSITKSIIKKHSGINKEIKLSLFNFKFIIHLCANPEKADIDSSKVISWSEATAVAISLSLDGLAVGIGASLAGVSGLAVFLFSLITDPIAIMLGCFVGSSLAKKVAFNLSWIAGIVLILLAFSNLV